MKSTLSVLLCVLIFLVPVCRCVADLVWLWVTLVVCGVCSDVDGIDSWCCELERFFSKFWFGSGVLLGFILYLFKMGFQVSDMWILSSRLFKLPGIFSFLIASLIVFVLKSFAWAIDLVFLNLFCDQLLICLERVKMSSVSDLLHFYIQIIFLLVLSM